MFTEPVQSRAEAKASTRSRVVEAADRLFREHGFASTTVRRIAAEAGVSVGTVMAVGDKDALLIEIFDRWIAAVHADRDRNEQLPKLDRAEAVSTLLATVEPFVAYFQSDRELASEFAAVVARGKHRSRVFTELAAELTADFERVFRAADHRDPAAAARTLYLAYIGLIRATSAGAFEEADSPARLAEAADLILGTGVSS